MPLGADRGRVLRMVVRQGMGMALAGAFAGVAGAFGMTRFMQGMLYGVTPLDPLTFASVPLLFAGVALLACWLPAARAARGQPAEAFRNA
jgi:putative ABC transport system permease protein